jgi:hypothetical protein
VEDEMGRESSTCRRGAYNILVAKPEGNRALGKEVRWEDNIKIDSKGIRHNDVERIHLAQDMNQWWVLVNMVMHLQVS